MSIVLHIGAVQLDIDSQRRSIWHRLTPQTRVICALLLVFAIALTPHGRWLTWAVYGLGVAITLLISRITLPVLIRRVAVEFAFVGVVLLGTLFREGGAVLWQWGWLRVTTDGMTVLGSVTLKVLLCLFTVNLLVLTTSIPALLHALARLKTPPLLLAIVSSMYRYIQVLLDEFNAMRRAAASRNLMGRRHWQRLVVGHMMGAIFIRTYERGDRIHQAMLARGYDGLLPLTEVPVLRWFDYVACCLTVTWILLGQLMPFLSSF